jgi:aldose 1-epimerase
MKLKTLENKDLKLVIAPDLGASPVAFQMRINDAWHDIMRPTSERHLERGQSAAFSSYTLAPYSNRVRDNVFRFQGRDYRLRLNWPDGQTIHGDVRDRPFQITRPDAQTLQCHYDSRLVQDKNFPFDYTFTTTYRFDGQTLETGFELTNVSPEPMPAGFGIHPYFVRHLNGSTADPILEFHAKGVYDVDERVMPSTAARAITPDLDFSSPKSAYLLPIDRVYNGWDGHSSLTWPGSGVRMLIEADPVFSHFVVFNGDPDGTLALEPVTNATDGFNLMDQGVPDTGVQILKPSETLVGHIWLKLERP